MIEEYQQAWDELTAPGAQFADQGDHGSRRADQGLRIGAAVDALRVGDGPGFGDRDYVVYEDERYTYAEADAIVRSLAHHLRDVHGVGAGDRVAIAMRNYPEWVFSYWAIVSLGAACVGMNAWWTTDEMKYGLPTRQPKSSSSPTANASSGSCRCSTNCAPTQPAPPDHGPLRRRPAGRRIALGRRGRSRDRHRPACRTRRSTPTTTPASSTPRARRVSRRVPS